jgi:hypothetical protein
MEIPERILERYLGDGAYVYHNGYRICFYTRSGLRETNRVALDDDALAAFDRWRADLKTEMERFRKAAAEEQAASEEKAD